MWTTFSVMVCISMVVMQVIMNYMLAELRSQCRELENRLADIECLTKPIDETWQSMYQTMQSIKQALSLYVK